MAKRPSSRKSPGHHVGGRGRGRKRSIGPSEDPPTPAEIEEFRRKIRAYNSKGDAERELDRIFNHFEAWRAREVRNLEEWQAEQWEQLELERSVIADMHEQLSQREAKQIHLEKEWQAEFEAEAAELRVREDRVIPTEKLVKKRRKLQSEQMRLVKAEEEYREKTQRLTTGFALALHDLQLALNCLESPALEPNRLGLVKRKVLDETVAEIEELVRGAQEKLSSLKEMFP